MITNDNTNNAEDESSSQQNNEININRLNALKEEELKEEDIHDSPKDLEKMKSETFVIDLPDVSDIPGQENIVVPNLGEMQDTTISSDDEEGLGLFETDEIDEDTDLVMGNEADVSATERTLLRRADEDMPVEDDPLLRRAELDKTDNQGDLLNEGSLATNVSGDDLDMSGVDADDAMEKIGEEDEENNPYSLGSDSNDNVTEGTP
ncbi:hypothetical protein [Segetibacter koreensis]|uniref:hypothetical protein n=1 Tax=Segetibacter koreensis TaxID=398037 RepID=UPI00035C2064|nr:hypothetical protein [Segetibacter koreensis]